MADIFDEINEDLKRDQMQELWLRYGKYVIIAVSLVVIGVGARQGYTAWQDRQATEAAAIYHQALKSDDTASALAAQLYVKSGICDAGAVPHCRNTGRKQRF
ncbi:MAG: tetratricopeptide repeat protein [Candidatus Puniceispirillaceae bacterium]